MFKREGIKLSESTISGWFRAVCKLFEPLCEEIRAQVLASGYINADETTLPLQSSSKPGPLLRVIMRAASLVLLCPCL